MKKHQQFDTGILVLMFLCILSGVGLGIAITDTVWIASHHKVWATSIPAIVTLAWTGLVMREFVAFRKTVRRERQKTKTSLG